MLGSGAPVGSARRSRSRVALATAALIAATIFLSGCLEEIPQLSDTCTQPATLNDGFFANRSAFFRVSTQTKPTDPQTTWVCYRVKVGNDQDHAGRIDVKSTSGANVGPVTTDGNSRACATGSNNTVPGPHPVEAGAVGDVGFYLDAYAGGEAAWLCLEVGSVKQRVIVPIPTADLPAVNLDFDPSPSPPQDTTPPPTGKASSSCYAGTYGPPSELINTHLDTRDLFLFTAQPSDEELHVCARLSGPAQSGGGRLSVNAALGQIVRVEESADTSSCTQNVVTLSNPAVSIKLTPPGQTPPSICVSGTRYTVVTGPVPPVVSWTPDT
jgi:hypothetical protein